MLVTSTFPVILYLVSKYNTKNPRIFRSGGTKTISIHTQMNEYAAYDFVRGELKAPHAMLPPAMCIAARKLQLLR